jgi:hypothetical protein
VANFLEFNCSACGQANLLDATEMPAEGVTRTCQSCGVSLFVRLEDTAAAGGSDELSVSTLPAGDAPEGGMGIHIRLPSGTVETVSADALAHGIQEGRVKAWDLVSDNGHEFTPASEHPELQRLFLPDDFTPVIQRRCANHPQGAPAGTCRKCGRSYCQECVTGLMRAEPRQCPACSGAVLDPDPRLTELPPWERWREILRYPIDNDAWKITAALGALVWLGGLSIFLFPLLFVALALVVHVAASSIRGEKKLAIDPNLDLKKLAEQVIPVAVFTIVVAGIVVGIELYAPPFARAVLQLPLTLASFAYLPMALGLLLLGCGTAKAFEPGAVIAAIKTLREDYLLIVLFLIAISVIVIALQTLFSFIPWLGRVLGAAALAYGAVAQAHALGSLLYLDRERILAVVR